ncbi:MAG TPA: 6-bladed beta-propeller [Candidatus Binataceae bacterium]|nr:6-bladed beta-propeller [Candidatus Binataceae bacterium]
MISRRCALLTLAGTIVCLALLTMMDCATQQSKPAQPAGLSWPPPPDITRIEFVHSLLSDKDLTNDTTISEEIVNFVAGTKPRVNKIMEPMGLAVSDDADTLYISDTAWNEVFIFELAHKRFSKLDGFSHPLGLALDGEQNLYVVDQDRRQVAVFDPSGKQLRTISDKSLIKPTGIAIDRRRGRIYVVDTATKVSNEHTVKIFAMDGRLLGHIGKGQGNQPGMFMFPTYIALDGNGDIYVTDTLNNRVQEFDPNGNYLRTVGANGDTPGNFGRPKGIAIDTFGDLYVVDSAWSNVQIFNSKGQVLMFFAGRGPMPGLLANPTAMAIDKNNHIYVGDYINHRVEEYQLVNTALADTQGGASTLTTASK